MKDLFGNEISVKIKIDRVDLAHALFKIFYGMPLSSFVRFFTNEYIEIMEYLELCLGKKGCTKTTLLFNPHRLQTKVKNQRWSIYQALQDKSFYYGLARALIFKSNIKHWEKIYQVLQLNINGAQYINEFPPYIARKLGKDYNLNLNSKILDPCGGWGGRMIGLSTLSSSYTCFEPCSLTYKGLVELSQFIQFCNKDFKPEVKNIPFEDSNLPNGYYDFALTSPPYYDIEEYTEEKTNSMNRYTNFEDWTNGFYLPMITKTMKALKKGSPFILNIGNRTYPLDTILKKLSKKYEITRIKDYLSSPGGLRNPNKGELFFEIRTK